MAVATLLAVIAALFLDDVRALLHRPEINLYVGPDLFDVADDFDGPRPVRWVRGRIKNIGDRGVKRCRLKLLNVEGQNLPPEASKIKNGFLQWQGGIRDSMTLNPGEHWIFDIGTRSPAQYSQLRLCAHFVRGGPLIYCNLEAPGTYTLTVGIYGDNIQSTERAIRIRIGEEGTDFDLRQSEKS